MLLRFNFSNAFCRRKRIFLFKKFGIVQADTFGSFGGTTIKLKIVFYRIKWESSGPANRFYDYNYNRFPGSNEQNYTEESVYLG